LIKVMAHDFPQPALYPVAPRGFADPAADSKCEPACRMRLLGLGVNEQKEQRVLPALSTLPDTIYLVRATQAILRRQHAESQE
jgi:hypothetical protein